MFEETIWVMQYVETNILDQLPTETVSFLYKNNGYVPMKKVIEGKKTVNLLYNLVFDKKCTSSVYMMLRQSWL